MKTVKDQWFLGVTGEGGIKRAQRIFRAVKTTLYDTTMVDTCHYTFVKTHRMYNTKSEPYNKLWTLGDNDVSMQVHRV